MAHLAVEKALKALCQARVGKVPPKTHNLACLLDRTGVEAPPATREFLVRLNEAHIATRYPDNLVAAQAAFPEKLVRGILTQSAETMEWIETQF